MKYHGRLLNPLGYLCGWLASFFEECERRLIVCPDCGRSRFYGPPCKNVPPKEES